MRILLTNDDGIHAVGLRAMFKALADAGHQVRVVAPLTEQSAVGHAVTMSVPLKARAIKENGFSGLGVTGTPVDCVKLGLTTLLADEPVDLVVSGINAGANVGVDILYSGTVAAATEAALMGLPALAVSMDDFKPRDLSAQAAFAADLAARIPWSELPRQGMLNLNFPVHPWEDVKGLRLCPQTSAAYHDWYVTRQDPRGNAYYWLEGVIPKDQVSPGTDRALLWEGWMTLTPLRFDFTDRATLGTLEKSGIVDTKPSQE
ncbi:MAG: 5'/3'-nucleotidase SurE [Thermodesulfobacteriota bacterium]